MKNKYKRFLLLGFLLTSFSVGCLLLIVSLRDNLVFFYSPSEIFNNKANLEKKIRVGGLVMPGSIKRERITLNEEKVEKISFLITDNNNEVRVSYIGILPDLFKEGQGAVIEGVWQHSQNYFKASLVLAKHDENYMPPEVKEILDRDEKK